MAKCSFTTVILYSKAHKSRSKIAKCNGKPDELAPVFQSQWSLQSFILHSPHYIPSCMSYIYSHTRPYNNQKLHFPLIKNLCSYFQKKKKKTSVPNPHLVGRHRNINLVLLFTESCFRPLLIKTNLLLNL